MNFGLLGRRLGHSYSPQIHGYFGDYSYGLYEKEPEELEQFMKWGDFRGLNVTAPYKKAVIPYLDQLSPAAQKIGAVNTILRRQDGSLYGHNTDYFGFLSLVRHSGISVSGEKVLVLGSGGASNTAVTVLKELGADTTVISRTGENNYSNLDLHRDTAVIVNTTPVGMYPEVGISPVDLKDFPRLKGVLDVVYNPGKTQLLLDAEALGIPAENGLWMLVAQAKEASEIFTGQSLEDHSIQAVYGKLRRQMTNLILIGMPGCGKTTVGATLARELGRTFVDADQMIVEKAGLSIPKIFEKYEETGFRRLEKEVLAELGKQSGLVIATGGGCVTQVQNLPLLHQNGVIIWLKRELDRLPTEGRPLSQGSSLVQMYSARKDLYQGFADHWIDNNETVQETAEAILALWEAEL